jgi:nicotinamide-nucleotide amidase
MKAAIVTIGDEILIGQIQDTNSTFMAKALDKIGFSVVEMLTISDDKQAILSMLSAFQNKVDVVLITGGLGPTKDDITKKTFCDFFNDSLVQNDAVLAHVTELIEGIYKRPITQLNKDQALVPSKAEVLFNKMGTAPGMWLKNENTVFVAMPGVPYEMKYLVNEEVIPRLVKEYNRPFIVHKTIMTYGVGESMLAEQIEDWENNLPSFVKLAYLPSPGRVRLRMSAKGTNEQELHNALNNLTQSLQLLIGDAIVGLDEDEAVEVIVGRLLKQKGKTISTAESCTGGKIAHLFTSVEGASAYFKGSIIPYETQMKTKLLTVSTSNIEKYSVVSSEVAKEMAQNCKQLFNSDYAIATTGNAGPTKGDSPAEVGTVFIGIATPNGVFVEEFNFGQPREKVLDRAVNKGLELVYKEILKN